MNQIFLIGGVVQLDHHDSPCALPLFKLGEDQVACYADIKRWYHNHATGECEEFSYDGCNKNANHFETKEECDKECADWHKAHAGHDHASHDHAKSHDHEHECKHEEHSHNHEGHTHNHEGHAHNHGHHHH